MRKQKWMMLGITAVVCSAMVVPGAFAKEKEDAYSVTNAFFAPAPNTTAPVVQKTDTVTGTQTTGTQTAGSAFIFAPNVNEKEKN
ncbi:hypothetical protein QIH01_11310 [Brevibacillus brevis]|uniref:hypothetical protein n=1 Tax=Brevibacillus brevis TaxID=1393 RepID=UPI0007D8C6E2|nr:hypothetical protein [Brevibacillus brevis]OUQ88690.1 hypothetical protein B5G50_09305 [Brevibacillus brevis]UIO44048.1 hypothetical protein LOY85_07790 [Brevibacillus brevis]WGV61702.1 hypothetical protein QIH01_11310 [Brevibacillus brevis]